MSVGNLCTNSYDVDNVLFNYNYLYVLDMILLNISEGSIVDSEPVVLHETVGSAWIDGHGCLGAVVGSFAMKKAIEKAAQNGIGWVTAKGASSRYFNMF